MKPPVAKQGFEPTRPSGSGADGLKHRRRDGFPTPRDSPRERRPRQGLRQEETVEHHGAWQLVKAGGSPEAAEVQSENAGSGALCVPGTARCKQHGRLCGHQSLCDMSMPGDKLPLTEGSRRS